MAYLSCWSFMFCVQLSSLACCLSVSRQPPCSCTCSSCCMHILVLFLLIDQTMLTYSFHPQLFARDHELKLPMFFDLLFIITLLSTITQGSTTFYKCWHFVQSTLACMCCHRQASTHAWKASNQYTYIFMMSALHDAYVIFLFFLQNTIPVNSAMHLLSFMFNQVSITET
jgi:hypothetical protein